MASNSSLSCVYDSLTGQGTDDVIPEGTCLHGSVTSLFRGSLDGRCHTYHGNTCHRNKDNMYSHCLGSSLSCMYESITGQGNEDAIPEAHVSMEV